MDTINNFRVRRFGERYFLTTDHGSHCVLDSDEYRMFRQGNYAADADLKKKLEEREIVLTERNVGEVIRLTRNRFSFLYRGTSLHIIVVTLRCNMQCIYCHASSQPVNDKSYDMDTETARKTVDFIFQSPNQNITIEFQGGETLLNWDAITEIIEYAQKKNETAKKNLHLTLVTNLSTMTHARMHYLIDNKVNICTSLDGPKKIHDYNRPFSGGSNYDHVIKWIKIINEEYKKRSMDKRINALVTLTKQSLQDPEGIIDEYVKNGIVGVHLRFLNNLGVAQKSWNDINYTVDEYLAFWKRAIAHVMKLQKRGITIHERMLDLILRKITNEQDPGYLDLRNPCGAAIGQLAYNYDGRIYTCDEARMFGEDEIFMLGNVKNEEYKDVVTCDKACAIVNASINDQYMCDACAYKPYCGVCPVCNYAEQGNVIGKISQTDRCKIFMAQFDYAVENIIMKKSEKSEKDDTDKA